MRLRYYTPAPLASIVCFLTLTTYLLPAPIRAEGTPTPIVRDHRAGQTVPPTPSPRTFPGGALGKYSIEMLRSNPPQFAPRDPIQSLEVEFRCPTCAPSDSLAGVTVEIWHSAGTGQPRLVGVRYNVELKGKGGGCTAHDSTCFGVPAGQFPAAEGSFIVKLIKDNSVASSSFNVVPTQLKIFGPTMRDHRTQ
jgi:hypothetical protein